MRKASVLSMRAIHVTVIALGFLSLSMSAQAFPFFKKKKKNTKATTETVKKDAYERILTEEKTDSARGPTSLSTEQVRNCLLNCHHHLSDVICLSVQQYHLFPAHSSQNWAHVLVL